MDTIGESYMLITSESFKVNYESPQDINTPLECFHRFLMCIALFGKENKATNL